MSTELKELFDGLSPEHQERLVDMAKTMRNIEKFQKQLAELTAVK